MAIQIPQPTAELVIDAVRRTDGTIAFINIYPHSLAAHVWIHAEAPKFGHLTDPSDNPHRHGERTLFFHPVYDPYEIIDYLESMDTADTPQGQEE